MQKNIIAFKKLKIKITKRKKEKMEKERKKEKNIELQKPSVKTGLQQQQKL